jgi:protein-tyrosine phosphatase
MAPSEPAYRICFVCLGNICRSPTAEAVMRRLLRGPGLDGLVAVESAGTGSWHVGADADARARGAFEARGYDLDHAARCFDPAWFADLDLVVAMDRGNLRALRALAPGAAREKVHLLGSFEPGAADRPRDVPDPYGGGPDGFATVLDLIEGACAGLLEHVRVVLAATASSTGRDGRV